MNVFRKGELSLSVISQNLVPAFVMLYFKLVNAINIARFLVKSVGLSNLEVRAMLYFLLQTMRQLEAS